MNNLDYDLLTKRIENIERCLGAFISWTAQSSVGVISFIEAKRLNDILYGKDANDQN